MTRPKQPIRATRPIKPRAPRRFAVPPPRTPQGTSLSSRIQRSIYWSYRNAAAAEQRDQQRQQDQAMLLHGDVAPNWFGDSGPVATADLADAPNGGQSTGSQLTDNGVSPPDGFIPPPG